MDDVLLGGMMRLANGILKKLADETKLSQNYLSDLARTAKRPGRQRSLDLERAAKEIGLNVSASLWMFGTSEQIKAALMGDDSLEDTPVTRQGAPDPDDDYIDDDYALDSFSRYRKPANS